MQANVAQELARQMRARGESVTVNRARTFPTDGGPARHDFYVTAYRPDATNATAYNGPDVLMVELPAECIADCTGPGAADEAVEAWVARLGATLPDRDGAIALLAESGGWERGELGEEDDETLIRRVLWVRAGDERG